MNNKYEELLIDIAFDPLVKTEISLKIFRELRRIKKENTVNEENE